MDKKILIIDGMYLMFKTYHATPPLKSKDGRATQLMHGVVNSLISMISLLKPTDIYFVMEGDHSYRKQIFPEYKATRSATPTTFGEEIPRVKTALSLMGIPLLEANNYEADDVIVSLIKQSDPSDSLFIWTTDKDIKAHLTPNSAIVAKVPGKKRIQIFNAQAIEEERKMKPSDIPYYLSLIGDSVDNVPGIKGVGDKTARKYMAAYPTPDDLLASDKLTAEQKQDFLLSLSLNTLKTDLPLTIPTPVPNLEACINFLLDLDMVNSAENWRKHCMATSN